MYKTPDFELHASGKVLYLSQYNVLNCLKLYFPVWKQIKVKTADFIPRILHFIADICETRSGSDFNAT